MEKTALITGVMGGIGRATARLFTDAGWQVIGVDKSRNSGAEELHHFIQADVSDEAASLAVFAEVSDRTSRLDALINNAGIQIHKPVTQMTVDEWDSVMAVNVRSIFLAVKHAYPIMRDHGGSIVNISSVHALATSLHMAAYAASKGAVLALTRALALELAGSRIRVNAVLPGAVDTPMLHAGLYRDHVQGNSLGERLEQLGSRHALGRIGRPQEIAQAVLFLSDPERSSFMTGQALVVDGGACARLSTE